MIVLFELAWPQERSLDHLIRWFQAVRRAAIEVKGVYDLALLYEDPSSARRVLALLDLEAHWALELFWQDAQVIQVLQRGEALGFVLTPKARLRRVV